MNLSEELKDIISSKENVELLFFIRPHQDREILGLAQGGFTSDLFRLSGEKESSEEYSSVSENEFCSVQRFDICVKASSYEYDSIFEVVGHIFGYEINGYALAEDIIDFGGRESFYIMDGTSHILYNFWENFKYMLSREEEYGFIDTNIYFMTNIEIVDEFFSPEMEDILLTKVIPNYYSKNGVMVENVIRTMFETELTDDFARYRKDYNYDNHIDVLLKKMNYKLIKQEDVDFPENSVDMLIKKI